MKIIVPMAGRGSRLRPHSLSTPKPLIPIAGSPIVHQLVKEIAKVVKEPLTDIGFVLGDPAFFGEAVEEALIQLAEELGARPHLVRQDKPLGTGHAVLCAAELLEGPAVVAYADTLIRANLNLDPTADGVIWVKKVDDPEAFGVVQLDQDQKIINLVEKPKHFVSDLAVIGIYYFKEIERLKVALEKYSKQELGAGKEYQINEGILDLINQGAVIKPGNVTHWMDCGNPEVAIETNAKVLGLKEEEGADLVHPSVKLENSKIIPPCFIGKNVHIKNSIIGPGVSIGEETYIENAELKNTLIQSHCHISTLKTEKAMIGHRVHYNGNPTFVSLGDYSELK